MMINALSLFSSLVLLLLSLSAEYNQKNDNSCPQNDVKSGFKCDECKKLITDPVNEIYLRTYKNPMPPPEYLETPECNRCGKTVKSVQICTRTGYKAPATCTNKCEEKSLKSKKCCDGKGKQMVKVTDTAMIVDRCLVCNAFAVPPDKIEHEDSKHKAWKCVKCRKIVKDGETCHGEDPVSFYREPQITEKVCEKSGESPHCKKDVKKEADKTSPSK